MDVNSQVFAALRWNAVAKLASQLANWAITIFIIRLLTPEDYGLMAMTAVFIGLTAGVADLGLGAAVVQARELTADHLRKVQGAITLACVSAFALLELAAPLIARFFGEPQLTALVRVLALEIVLAAPGVLAGALLLRQLRLRTTATVEFSAGLIASCVTLALAWRGFGVWSLVATGPVRAAIISTGFLALAPARSWPSFGLGNVGSLLKFGGWSTVNQLLNRLGAQLDTLIAGKVLAPEQVGAYAVAVHIASLPASKLSGVIGDIVFPAFARLQEDRSAVRHNMLQALGILAFFAFPTFFGLSAVAREAVYVVLGAKWEGAIVPLMLVPLVLPLRLLNGILVTAASSMGAPLAATRYHATFLGVFAVAMLVGSRWELLGLSLAWVVALPVVLAVSLGRSLGILGLAWRDVAAVVVRPLAAAATMALCVHVVRYGGSGSLSQVGVLGTGIVTGVAAYVIASLAINRPGVRQALSFGRRFVGTR